MEASSIGYLSVVYYTRFKRVAGTTAVQSVWGWEKLGSVSTSYFSGYIRIHAGYSKIQFKRNSTEFKRNPP